MKKALIVACRDFKSYFTSPLAYMITALFLFVMGYMFYQIFGWFAQMASQMGKETGLTEAIVRPIYVNMNLILLFVVPFITMRQLSEERKLHSLELLTTSPITSGQIVLGKFFAASALIFCMLLPTLAFPGILILKGNPDLGPILTCHFGTWLLASCYAASGLLFSSLTENQIVAGMLGLLVNLFIWLLDWAAKTATSFWKDILEYLSLIRHYDGSMSQGVLNTADLVYYISFIGIGLFLTKQVLESHRWR